MRRATISWTVHLVLGLVAGWAPWLVEMTARFGSPGEAFAAAARMSHTGRWSLFGNVRQYLALSDGPTIGSTFAHDIPVSGLFWLVGMAILVVLGIRAASSAKHPAFARGADGRGHRSRRRVHRIHRCASPEVLVARAGAPRGSRRPRPGHDRRRDRGTRSSRDRRRFARRAVASILVITWAIVQLGIASSVEADAADQRASARTGRPRSPQALGRGAVSRVQRGEFPDRRVRGRMPRGSTRQGRSRCGRIAPDTSNVTEYGYSSFSAGPRRFPRPKAPRCSRMSRRKGT